MMASVNENTPLLGTSAGGASSLPGASQLSFSPGGYSLSYSYGRQLASQRGRGSLRTGRGTGRKVIPRSTNDKDDPLQGVRKAMPYESLVKELENNPQAEIRRISSTTPAVSCENQRLRLKYYNTCRDFARRREQEVQEEIQRELESHGVFEATIYEDGETETDHHDDGFLVYPDHMLTPQFFVLQLPLTKTPSRGDKQSSLITILSIWNTMMGTSLLSVPWAISQSGLATGLIIAFGMCFIAAYTASIILRTHRKESVVTYIPEFAQMCGKLMGPFWEYMGSIFSLLAVTGAAVVYWVLMSNFLYNTVTYIYDRVTGNSHVPGNSSSEGIYCPNNPDANDLANLNATSAAYIPSEFDVYWNSKTVPCFLLVLLPLISLKSVTFFTKFNSLGTVTVVFLIGVVIYYASIWGINVNFTDVTSPEYVPMYKGTFCSLSGMLALGLFIHNAIITIVANNRHQENNMRDTFIAFGLVIFTYMFIGVLFYISFPLPKSCIEDNFLNNFHLDDTITVICRALILFQLITVFPLIMYLLRSQCFLLVIGRAHENLFHIIAVNSVVLIICIIVACYYPSIGTIIRFSGAICGFVILFLLPCLVHLKSLHKEGNLTRKSIYIHMTIIMLGCSNVVAQFLFF